MCVCCGLFDNVECCGDYVVCVELVICGNVIQLWCGCCLCSSLMCYYVYCYYITCGVLVCNVCCVVVVVIEWVVGLLFDYVGC